MGQFETGRAELKEFIKTLYKAKLKAQYHPDTPDADLDVIVEVQTEKRLDEFESLAVRRYQSQQAAFPRDGFWRGVWQSAIGSFLFVILAALFLFGIRFDFVAKTLHKIFGP